MHAISKNDFEGFTGLSLRAPSSKSLSSKGVLCNAANIQQLRIAMNAKVGKASCLMVTKTTASAPQS
ncbi:MAG: hypothetical protein EBQ48_08330, partial [Betaproteobacteria bacterium]|nr:hypothetical protein [Betaproteobacteria bacterium]